MVETDAAISRLQSTLLRLPKDDLIKLLKSTYQAMRIKHGIPYERAESRAATSAAQRDLRGKSTKSQGVSQGKRKHSTARKKATDGAPDAGSFGKVEQPTFRQVESLTEDLSNLNLSSISYDSDLPETSAEPGRCESSPIPCAAPTPEDVMNDREFAIQTLKDEAKQLVPPLDFSTIDTSAKEAYKFSDFIKPSYSDTQGESLSFTKTLIADAHVNRVESAVPDAYSAVRGSGRVAADAPAWEAQGIYGNQIMRRQPTVQPRMAAPASYTVTPRPGTWVQGYPAPQYLYPQGITYPGQVFRPVAGGQIVYRDSRQMGRRAPSQVRGHSVQRL